MLPDDDPESRIREFARQFFRLAAANQLAQACAMLDEPNTYGQTWTPASIISLLNEIFGPESSFRCPHSAGPRFSSPDDLADHALHELFGAFDDGSGYWYDADVPLNGGWSDVTAEFEFKRRSGGLAAVLHALHVT